MTSPAYSYHRALLS